MKRVLVLPVALVVLAAIVLGGIALAGSGDDGPSGDALEAPTETAAPPAASGSLPPAFVECMADQRVEVASPDDLHQPGAQQAFQVCIPVLHGG